MKKRLVIRWCLIGIVIMLWIGCGIARPVADYVSDRRASQIAEQWENEANQAVLQNWTEERSKLWLQEKGFRGIFKAKRWSEGPKHGTEHGFVVVGSRQVIDKAMLVKPCWLEVTFVFDERRQFKRVESQTQAYGPFRTP